MKKTLTKTLIAATIISCGLTINTLSAQTHYKKKAPIAKKPTALEIAQGKDLVSKSDCLTCHKVDVKVVGPAYKDVAAKYPATAASYATLTQKVIAGGSGNWGTIPMAPHPNLAPADVKKMVEYILTLK